MTRRSRLLGVALAAAGACAGGFTGDETPRGAIERANELYRSARFSEAAEAYAKIETEDPAVTPDLLHNRAAAAFKQGDYAKARDLWVRAATLKDAAFEATARYNLGNCAYREALDKLAPANAAPDAPAEPPIDEVIPLVERAIEQYQDALRLDPSLVDARANLELAAQLLEKLKENPTSQPQSQSQPDSQPQSQPQSQPSSQPQEGQQGDQSDQQSQSQPSSQPQSQPSSSPSSQSQPSSQPDDANGNPDEGEENPQSQPSPGDEPKPDTQPVTQPASRPSPQSQPGDEDEQGEQGEAEAKELPPVRLTPEQAERLLQMVRDAEKARREALRARERGKQRPVERDW